MRDWKGILGKARKPTYLVQFMALEIASILCTMLLNPPNHLYIMVPILEMKNPAHKD